MEEESLFRLVWNKIRWPWVLLTLLLVSAYVVADGRRPYLAQFVVDFPASYGLAIESANMRESLPGITTLRGAGALEGTAQDFADPERFDVLEVTLDCDIDRGIPSKRFPKNIVCHAQLYGAIGGAVYYKQLEGSVVASSDWPAFATAPGLDYQETGDYLSGVDAYLGHIQESIVMSAITLFVVSALIAVAVFVGAFVVVLVFSKE